MKKVTDLPPWECLMKRMVWQQLGDTRDKKVLDFGSGIGVTANYLAELKITKTLGVRTFWDLQQNQENHKDADWQDKMIEIEMRVSNLEEYKDIAFFHHLTVEKR